MTTPPRVPVAAPYCTVIRSRSPEQKMHSGIGQAKAAVGYQAWRGARGGQVYKLVDGAWELLYDIAPGTPIHELPWRQKAAQEAAEQAQRAAQAKREREIGDLYLSAVSSLNTFGAISPKQAHAASRALAQALHDEGYRKAGDRS